MTTHQSVENVSQMMKVDLKRYNYVTPTNYLELVSGYKKYAVTHSHLYVHTKHQKTQLADSYMDHKCAF